MLKWSNEDRVAFYKLIVESFTQTTLAHALSSSRGVRLDTITTANSFQDVAMDVVEKAESEGWLDELVQIVHVANRGNRALDSFVESLLERSSIERDKFLPTAHEKPFDLKDVGYFLPRREHSELIGREPELEKLRGWLSSRTSSFISITGLRGIGKTALILEGLSQRGTEEPANHLKQLSPPIIYISAKDELISRHTIVPKSGVENWEQFVTVTCMVLGQDQQLERYPPAYHSNFLKRVLSDHRALLIFEDLDRVADAAIYSFLRELPELTKCIVSSCKDLDGLPTNRDAIQLNELGEREREALIQSEGVRRRWEFSPRQLKLLSSATGGIPMVIKWGVEEIGTVRDFEIAHRELMDPGSTIYEYIFQRSLQSLESTSPYALQLLTALSMFPDDASEESLKIVAQIPNDEFASSIACLQSYSLVSVLDEGISALDITKNYVRHKTAKEKTQEHQLTILDYYIQLAGSYSGELWHTHRKNIIGLIAAQQGVDSVALIRSALHLVTAYINKLENSRFQDDIFEISELAIDLSRSLGSIRQQVDFMLDYYGMVHFLRSEYSKAEVLNREILALSKGEGYSIGAAKAYRNLGGLAKAQGRYPEAYELLIKALEHLDESQADQIRVVKGLLSSTLRKLKRFDEARELIMEEIEYCRGQGTIEENRLSVALCRLGTAYLEEENPRQAIPYYQESLQIDETLGRDLSIGYNLFKIARCYNMLGEQNLAHEYAEKAERVSESLPQTNLPGEIREFLGNLGGTSQIEGDGTDDQPT